MIGIRWTGWDGSEWDLRTGNVRLATGGIEGLNTFKFDSYTTDSAARDGQRFQGWRAQPRTMLLPVLLGRGGLSDLQYLALESAWWRTMRPGKYGTLTVTTPDGGERHASLRFVDDGGHAFDIDPTRRKLTGYALNMVADDPYWYGRDPWSLTFRDAGASVSFLGGKPTANTYAWTNPAYVGGYGSSTETINGVTRTNLAFTPNARARRSWVAPYIDATTTTFVTYLSDSGLDVARDFARVVVSAVGTGTGDMGVGATSMPLTPNVTYTSSMYVRPSRASTMRLRVQWLNDNGDIIFSAYGATTTIAANAWARVSYTGAAPAGGTSAIVTAVVAGWTPNLGDMFDGAAMLIEASPTVGDYFDGSSGKGTPIRLTSAFTTDATTLTNPGDVEAYPVYTLQGPLSGFRIENDGAVLASNVAIAADQQLVINTSPIAQTAYLYKADGTYTNVIKQLTGFGFKSIQPGSDVKLTVRLTGTGSLTVSGEPRYFKAW